MSQVFHFTYPYNDDTRLISSGDRTAYIYSMPQDYERAYLVVRFWVDTEGKTRGTPAAGTISIYGSAGNSTFESTEEIYQPFQNGLDIDATTLSDGTATIPVGVGPMTKAKVVSSGLTGVLRWSAWLVRY